MLIFAPVIAVGLGLACKNIDKSIEIDEKALKRLRKAYSLQYASKFQVEAQLKEYDQALERLLTRKISITQYSLKPFVTLYEKIINIELDDKLISRTQIDLTFPSEKYGSLMVDHNIKIQSFTGKEALVSLLKGGITGLMVDESKRDLLIAGKHLKIAEAYASNAENIGTMLHHIIDEAGKISTLLGALNIFLLKAIKASDELIDLRGNDKRNYTEDDREILRNTINIAKAIKDIIDSPVIDENGKITEQLKSSYQFAQDFYKLLNRGV